MYSPLWLQRTVCLISCMVAVFFSADAQNLIYTSTTEDVVTTQKIFRKDTGDYLLLELREPTKYSGHYFLADGNTKKWVYQDKSQDHKFVAERKGNIIIIVGRFQDKPLHKTVSIDGHTWLNKIDHGLSYFANSPQDEMTFWTLTLSDLEPMQFKAYKEETETVMINGQPVQAQKVKITLKNILLSKLWSAYLWYRVSDGLFLKYEGTTGKPGTPVTVIEMVGKA